MTCEKEGLCEIQVWDSNVLEPVEEFTMTKLSSAHLRKSPSPLVAIAGTNHVNLIDLKSGSTSHELRGHGSAAVAVKWSPTKDHILVSGDHDGRQGVFEQRNKAKNMTNVAVFTKLESCTIV